MMHPAIAMAAGIVCGWQLCLLWREIRAAWRNRPNPVVDVRVKHVNSGGISWNELEVVRKR
jgi:hypothetical protein